MRRSISIFITFIILVGLAAPLGAAGKQDLDAAVAGAAAYILGAVKNPQVGSVGGEWAVIGLARSGRSVPEAYYELYYKNVEKYVKDNSGLLHDRKYTEYSRVVLALTAAGYDPRNVAGYDLTAALGDFEKTIWQGINGPIFALLALDSFDYPIPVNKDAQTQATRDLYIAEILRRQTPDGGWNLTAGTGGLIGASEKGEPDITAMALQALARYQYKPEVKTATEKALTLLSRLQDKTGGYAGGADADSESVVQVLTALCELGISVNDSRFVKNGLTLIDNILSFKNSDGSFRHTGAGERNTLMSGEQALYGLAAAKRAAEGKNSLYRMSDTVRRGAFTTMEAIGLPNKDPGVRKVNVVSPGKTFTDIKNHKNRVAIEALAARNIVSGKSAGLFDPEAAMTRAEFTAIVTGGLGLKDSGQWSVVSGQSKDREQETKNTGGRFLDVKAESWYFGEVETACYYGIVSGTSETTFNPGGTINRQEAAVMIASAAKLCGMDTGRTATEIRDSLAQFGDYRSVASWAQPALAFCFSEGLLDETAFGFNIDPTKPIKRCEVAEMLYRLLDRANLMN